MVEAQLLAAHNAAMECYRRAIIPEQSRDQPSQQAVLPSCPQRQTRLHESASPAIGAYDTRLATWLTQGFYQLMVADTLG